MATSHADGRKTSGLADAEIGLRGVDVRGEVAKAIYERAARVAARVITKPNGGSNWQSRLDSLLTSRHLGIPIMLALLAGVFWLTLDAANLPSQLLSDSLLGAERHLGEALALLGVPVRLRAMLTEGVYRTVAWVVAVMLPPMAIFFPLFALLEDSGYLPRIAFNLDGLFRASGSNGKQAFTMCMGFGCNAVGVVACRIIESPRERLLAILTNTFVPCNGRFPAIIALSTVFLGVAGSAITSTWAPVLAVLVLVLVGFGATLLVSYILTRTFWRGTPSAFVLELPPYRAPRLGQVLLRSVIDRTARVLVRAVIMAALAGVFSWLIANTFVDGISVLQRIATMLNPAGKLLGMDGTILMAFILGLPANEIVLPIIVMTYLSKGALMDADSLSGLHNLLVANGWTAMTAICVMLFSLLHFPCSTTLWTIKRETKSWGQTLLAAVIPTLTGIVFILVLRAIVGIANLVFG